MICPTIHPPLTFKSLEFFFLSTRPLQVSEPRTNTHQVTQKNRERYSLNRLPSKPESRWLKPVSLSQLRLASEESKLELFWAYKLSTLTATSLHPINRIDFILSTYSPLLSVQISLSLSKIRGKKGEKRRKEWLTKSLFLLCNSCSSSWRFLRRRDRLFRTRVWIFPYNGYLQDPRQWSLRRARNPCTSIRRQYKWLHQCWAAL